MENATLISKKISIIGAGRVGQSLARALSKKGYIIGGLSCRNLADAQKAVLFLGEGYACRKNAEAVEDSGIIFITTPDDVISEIAEELERAKLQWKGRVVFHCSGVLSSALLSPLKKAGAATASLHPLQSLPAADYAEKALQGIFFALEGDDEACQVGEGLAQELGSQVLYIKPEAKALYHAAAAIASNYLTTLLFLSCKTMEKAGISLKQAESVLLPLMKGTLANIERLGILQSLTGPISRGDERTIILHLKALNKEDTKLEKLYRFLGLKTLRISRSLSRLSQDKIKSIETILKPLD